MKGRDALRELLSEKPPEVALAPPKRSTGAVRAMNLELQQLSDEAAAARALRQTLANREHVVELDPESVDTGLVADRIPLDNDPAFDQLKEAIATRGQQVPILVRPSPEGTGRFQVAYGKRRLRAAAELKIQVKAIVRQLTDRELVIAQAQENGPRADLSFVEKAVYATNLSAHGFDRDTIALALGVDKPELSRLLTVTHAITPELIAAIGPAPKAGRPRWLKLAEKCGIPSLASRAEAVVRSQEFASAATNARFNLILAAMTETGKDDQKTAVTTMSGHKVGWIERTRKGLRLHSDQPAFARFLERRLPELLEEFDERSHDQPSNPGEGPSDQFT